MSRDSSDGDPGRESFDVCRILIDVRLALGSFRLGDLLFGEGGDLPLGVRQFLA